MSLSMDGSAAVSVDFAKINTHRRTVLMCILGAKNRLPKKEWRTNASMIWGLFCHSLHVEPDGAGLPCVVQATHELMTPL